MECKITTTLHQERPVYQVVYTHSDGSESVTVESTDLATIKKAYTFQSEYGGWAHNSLSIVEVTSQTVTTKKELFHTRPETDESSPFLKLANAAK